MRDCKKLAGILALSMVVTSFSGAMPAKADEPPVAAEEQTQPAVTEEQGEKGYHCSVCDKDYDEAGEHPDPNYEAAEVVTGDAIDVVPNCEGLAEAKSFDIAYNIPKDASMPEDAKTTYTCEEEFTLPTPEREGYTFAGWVEGKVEVPVLDEKADILENVTDKGVTIKKGETIALDANSTVKSNTDEKVAFVKDGVLSADKDGETDIAILRFGTVLTFKVTVKDGEMTILLTDKNGKNALTEDEILSEIAKNSTKVEKIEKGNIGAKEYTSLWVAKEYTITLDGGDYGRVLMKDKKVTVTYGKPVKDLPVPEEDDVSKHYFIGYIDGAGKEVGADYIYQFAEDTTFVANYSDKYITLTVDDGIIEEDIKIPEGRAVKDFLPEVEKSGYTFVCFLDEDGKEVDENMVLKKDTKFTCKFDANEYTLTFDGVEDKDLQTKTLKYKTEIGTLPTLADKEDYRFAGWSVEGETITEDSLYTFTGNETATPIWKFISATVAPTEVGKSVRVAKGDSFALKEGDIAPEEFKLVSNTDDTVCSFENGTMTILFDGKTTVTVDSKTERFVYEVESTSGIATVTLVSKKSTVVTLPVSDSVEFKGITYKASGGKAYVLKAKTTVTSASIPSTVKIGGKTLKVTSIKANAFKGCKKLKSVTIGKNITSIGSKAFYGCKALKSIKITSKSVKTFGSACFKGIYKKAKVTVPKAKKNAYSKKLYKVGISKKTMKVK